MTFKKLICAILCSAFLLAGCQVKSKENHYLFVHFTGEHEDGEQVYFSVSQDGRHFEDLNGSLPVLQSTVGNEGVRDPFIVRDVKKQKFYLIATDLRIAKGEGWEAAQVNGSKNIVVWESEDLIQWQSPRLLPVDLPGAGNVWAPEAIYDDEKEAFLVFWASKISGKQRMYAAYTEDFTTLGEPFPFLEKTRGMIDSTVIKHGQSYYRLTKDETYSRIMFDKADSLTGDYEAIASPLLRNLKGMEGPQIYRVNEHLWYLIIDNFAANNGYIMLQTTDLGTEDFTLVPKTDYDFGKSLKRHGGVLPITNEEYGGLVAAFGKE